MVKNPEATASLSKGFEALATALSDIAKSQSQVAQALMAPKVSVLSADGMTATTRVQ
jgi:hypothetical protein